MRRRPRALLSLGVVVAFCTVAGVVLFAEFERQADEWNDVRHGFYAGPVSFVTQPFRIQHDYLSRIDIWADIEGGSTGAVGDVLARVIPHGADAAIRESRIGIRHQSTAGAPLEIRFTPIPDSGGTLYILELTVLSSPPPFVFLGITGSDMNPAGQVSINGDASRAHLDLAMRPYWTGRGGRVLEHLVRGDPWRLFLIVDAALWGLLIVFAVVAAWRVQASGHWYSLFRHTAGQSVLITLGLAIGVLLMLMILSASPQA